MVGERIGQYFVRERLGNGGMGAVYRATDETLDREVALKILDAGLDESGARLRAEAAALARLSHPGIATVYELIDDGGQLVMVLEFVRGQSLQARLEQVGPFTPRQAMTICMDILAALEHAHASGVIHRDLKPANLMITDAGKIKILDFGIARLEGSIHLTSAGAMVGTPAYMAPEQVLGLPIDQRTDLYAMGVVFYRLVTAALPFKGDTPFAMAQSQVSDPPTPIRLMRPDFPAWVDEIVARSLTKAPEGRFQTAREFHDALASHWTVEPAAISLEKTIEMDRPLEAVAPRRIAFGRLRLVSTLALCAAALTVVATAWPSSGATAESATATSNISANNPAPQEPTATVTPVSTGPSLVAHDASPVKRNPPPASPPRAVEPPVSFSHVKLLTVTGRSTDDHEVLLTFDGSRLTATRSDRSEPDAAIPYARIAAATYHYGRDPQWKAGFSGPAATIDVPGILGRRRHWLTVQARDAYAILRLDGTDREEILKVFSARTGVNLDRPAPASR